MPRGEKSAKIFISLHSALIYSVEVVILISIGFTALMSHAVEELRYTQALQILLL